MMEAERSEVSRHEVLVYRVLRCNPDRWLTNREIAAQVDGVASRTVRLHTRRLVSLGLVEQAEVFPAHGYRWAKKTRQWSVSQYLQRLERASEVFGLAPV